MERPLFRKKSLERISSPEQLNDYLRVTAPAVWVALSAVILLLLCLFIWSSVTAVESFAAGTAQAEGSVLTITFDDQDEAGNIKPGMDVRVNALRTEVLSVGTREDGSVVAVAMLPIPDGVYPARVSYDRIQIIRLLFN